LSFSLLEASTSSMICSGSAVVRPHVVVHGLDQAVAVLRLGRAVALISAPGAALAGGCGWWQAMIEQARKCAPDIDMIDILDCANAPGLAMAALRNGQRRLILERDCKAYPAVAAAAHALGALVLPIRPACLDMAARGADRALAAYLGASSAP